MRRGLSISILLLLTHCAFAFTNEVDGTFDSASYDTGNYVLWGNYFATAFYNENPQFTNHILSWSRSGSSIGGDYQEQEFKWCGPWWNASPVPVFNWVLAANDNGGFVSNDIVTWWTEITSGPPNFWNRTASTNEGIPFPTVTHFPFGGIIADVTDGDSGQLIRNNAATNLAAQAAVPVVDMWHRLSPVWIPDRNGARKWGFYDGGHPYPAGHLAMAITTLQALSVNTNYGVDTNVGAFILDATTLSAATNHCVISGSSRSGNTITLTVHFDRMPPSWDVPDGTITNDARDAFVVMPELGNAFRWMVAVTNLPSGQYNILVDGILTDLATDAQLAAGRNWFTNYNGPLWAQRVAVLNAKRDQEGSDHVTLLPHSAGEGGTIPGVGDLVNYQSHAGVHDEVYPLTYTGTNFINYMKPSVSDVRQYDVKIWQAAQQTNHTLAFVLIQPRYVGARR